MTRRRPPDRWTGALFPPEPGELPIEPTDAPPAAPPARPARPVANTPPAAPALSPLAEGLARHVRQWALQAGATPADAAAAAAAAAAVSTATADGHVCLPLAALVPALAADSAALRARLLASGVVGTGAAPGAQPLVLDDGDRLYLHRHFDLERRLARRLLQAARAPFPADAEADASSRAQLDALFGPSGADDGPDWQRLAAALALHSRLAVVSGGPGTGKTTTVVNLLACLLSRQPEARVVLAAPTGKAAARLSEALRDRAAHLPAALQARLPAESFTVHRLLGVRPPGRGGSGLDAPSEGGFVHHAGQPLALDVLVVDEASMLDLALATRLLEAVPAHARIVLLGDKDQLAAVESGAVFAELSADPTLSDAGRARLAALGGTPVARIRPPAPVQPSPLRDCAVWFDRNFRFARDSGIGRLAADTLAGRDAAALAWLARGDDDAVHWLDDHAPAPLPATLAQAGQGYAPHLAACQAHAAAAGAGGAVARAATVTAAFNRFRVLCALRSGPRGVQAVNDALTRRLRPALEAALAPALAGGAADPRSPWYPGRPVMVLHNDYGLRLYNGDIGIALPDADGRLMVWFPAPDGGLRALPPLRLPAHQTAWAMTVHKSQGSEFDAVLLLLPARPGRGLSRELLYTGLTRARSRVWLAAGRAVLAAAMHAPTRRDSGLLARLAETVEMTEPAAAAPGRAPDGGPTP